MHPGVEKAFSSAYDLLKKYSIDKPPVNVEDIAERLGVVIARHHFAGSSQDLRSAMTNDAS